MKCINQLQLNGKRVFLRVDLNVPFEPGGGISDYRRIEAVIPTVEYALERGASLVVASHLGRPKGKVNPQLSLKPVADYLKLHLNRPLYFATDCVGPEIREQADRLKPGEVLLLENLRFHAEEEENDPDFSKELSQLAEIYVNDAFGTAHRAHASTFGMVFHIKTAAIGFLMQREIENLQKLLDHPQRPFCIVLGGAKAKDKIALISNMIGRVDSILIGGALANTFLKSSGVDIGASRYEEEKLDVAKSIEKKMKQKGIEALLPQDAVVTPHLSSGSEQKRVAIDRVPSHWHIVDIGPKTTERFCAAIEKAKTIFWNGPMGLFEISEFSRGTQEIGSAISRCRGLTVAGGGDTLAAIDQIGLHQDFSHISTGGGASLAYLAGKKLPAIEVLESKG